MTPGGGSVGGTYGNAYTSDLPKIDITSHTHLVEPVTLSNISTIGVVNGANDDPVTSSSGTATNSTETQIPYIQIRVCSKQ